MDECSGDWFERIRSDIAGIRRDLATIKVILGLLILGNVVLLLDAFG